MIEIQVRHDRKRGCGWRKPGGKYLIGGSLCAPCGKLPYFLDAGCPTCGHGIKPMRGWRWINASLLFRDWGTCFKDGEDTDCTPCLLCEPPVRAGLIWIGDTFYSPAEFVAEAVTLGISRRIACVPKGFQVGKTLVLLASRHVPKYGDNDALFRELPLRDGPGIFAAFVPTALEYMVKGSESTEELERLDSQGFTLVRIERVVESGGDEERGEGTRPGPEVAGPPGVRSAGHGADDGPPRIGGPGGSVQ